MPILCRRLVTSATTVISPAFRCSRRAPAILGSPYHSSSSACRSSTTSPQPPRPLCPKHQIPVATNAPVRRAMSSSSEPQKYEWLVILPDQEGALDRRMEVRGQHLSNLSKLPPDFMLWGGGFLSEPPKEGEPMKMLGSAMLVWAASKDDVLEILKGDIYTKNQVWDWSKVQIYPFKSAVRKPL